MTSLVKDLFALRFGTNLKRMWLHVHNLLGLFSLPFHIVMAVTSAGFAFFPYAYQSQAAVFGYRPVPDEHAIHAAGPMLSPAVLVARVEAQAPGFRVAEIGYVREKDGGIEAQADVNPYTGALTEPGFFPGRRGYAGGFATNFIAAHFGNFGGDPVRWIYFLLGMAGAALFYTGNLLWIESRRRRERRGGRPEQTRATRVLGALTVGISPAGGRV